MFAKDLSNKIFLPPRHEAICNKNFFFVPWCLCGYSFRFIRVGCVLDSWSDMVDKQDPVQVI
jgi:hypothetical protein